MTRNKQPQSCWQLLTRTPLTLPAALPERERAPHCERTRRVAGWCSGEEGPAGAEAQAEDCSAAEQRQFYAEALEIGRLLRSIEPPESVRRFVAPQVRSAARRGLSAAMPSQRRVAMPRAGLAAVVRVAALRQGRAHSLRQGRAHSLRHAAGGELWRVRPQHENDVEQRLARRAAEKRGRRLVRPLPGPPLALVAAGTEGAALGNVMRRSCSRLSVGCDALCRKCMHGFGSVSAAERTVQVAHALGGACI